MARVLIVAKTPLVARIPAADLERLIVAGVAERDVVQGSADRHRETLAAVRAALCDDTVEIIRVEAVRAGQDIDTDLVITVGGDGTVFTAASLRTTAPFITVNSDPLRSVGNYARATSRNVGQLIQAWRNGHARREIVPRLEVRLAGQRWPFVNDCLFTNPNPAAMCRYMLETPQGRSLQRSSGVWISTAAGSTGAIRSAGLVPDPNGEALFFKVREPFQPPAGAELQGQQRPPAFLRLIPAGGGAVCYLDGPNLTVPVPPGDTITITASDRPLALLRDG